jgi:hypothetical protein
MTLPTNATRSAPMPSRDQHPVGRHFRQHRFEPLHDAGRLHRVGAAAHAEEVVGSADIEIVEERLRHVRIVVLPRVDQHRAVAAAFELRQQGRDLHEVRPGSGHQHHIHDGRSCTWQSARAAGAPGADIFCLIARP